jgi:hypothetical protein
MPWKNEREYMASWVWLCPSGRWYCRITHEFYATREVAEEVVRQRDREASIVWPWQRAEKGEHEGQP